MSWLSKAAKKVEHTVSRAATKVGVGNDLKKAANVFGAANVGGAVGIVTGFLSGGVSGAVYGAATGATVAAIGKYKGDTSSKYLSNAAGDALIAGSVGPLIYKPGATALITAPGPVSGYAGSAGTITVKTASGGFLGSISNLGGGLTNAIKDSLSYIGKGGITQIAIDSIRKIFSKGDPSTQPNPDYQQGNAVPPGGTFPSWLTNILPGKSYDPTAPGASTAGGGGSSPVTNVSGTPVSLGVTSGDGGSAPIDLFKPALIVAAAVGGFFLLKNKRFAHG